MILKGGKVEEISGVDLDKTMLRIYSGGHGRRAELHGRSVKIELERRGRASFEDLRIYWSHIYSN